MDFETAVALSLPLMFLIMMAIESIGRSGRSQSVIRHWRWIGIAGLLVSLACNALMPMVIVPLLSGARAFDLAGLGLLGALPVFVLTTFFTYWSHRIQHRFDLLWRLGHQLHHGVARVDIASAMIFHPIDLFVQVTMTVLAATLLGVTANAAALAGAIGFFAALFQHWNLATPRWTGWLIQRPEAHMLHHQRDVHARNFGDIPLWDMIFGTYENPLRADVEVGFEPERSRRWVAMVMCVDVNKGAGRERI